MMAIFGGLVKGVESIAICGAIIMSAGYLGLVLDNIQKKKSELIKIIVNDLRK